jgi:hypothetical protein
MLNGVAAPPPPRLHDVDFWAQGISLGIEVIY